MKIDKVKSKRVLHVLFSAGLGGCESLCVDLARNLDQARWPSEVVFLSEQGGPTRDRLESFGVPVHVCPYDRQRRFDFVRRFSRLCRKLDVHTVITHSFGVHLFVAVGARLGGVKQVFVSVQNPPPSDKLLRRKTAVLAQLSRPFVSKEIACSHYVSNLASQYYALPNKRIAVVWNWCDIKNVATRAASVREYRQSNGPILGIVARLDPIKDQATVIRAFAQFCRKYPAARLRLIGDGPSRASLEALTAELGISDRVQFLGAKLDVPEQIADLDIFVFATTENEGFGIVLAEAMAAGVPIIATDIGPCSEVLDGGRAGMLVPARDPTALAEGMEKLWESPSLRNQLVEGALATVQERYSSETAASRYEEFLCT
jgi:glycosyltransferase involved in cell wall biosynthesis